MSVSLGHRLEERWLHRVGRTDLIRVEVATPAAPEMPWRNGVLEN